VDPDIDEKWIITVFHKLEDVFNSYFTPRQLPGTEDSFHRLCFINTTSEERFISGSVASTG